MPEKQAVVSALVVAAIMAMGLAVYWTAKDLFLNRRKEKQIQRKLDDKRELQ